MQRHARSTLVCAQRVGSSPLSLCERGRRCARGGAGGARERGRGAVEGGPERRDAKRAQTGCERRSPTQEGQLLLAQTRAFQCRITRVDDGWPCALRAHARVCGPRLSETRMTSRVRHPGTSALGCILTPGLHALRWETHGEHKEARASKSQSPTQSRSDARSRARVIAGMEGGFARAPGSDGLSWWMLSHDPDGWTRDDRVRRLGHREIATTSRPSSRQRPKRLEYAPSSPSKARRARRRKGHATE